MATRRWLVTMAVVALQACGEGADRAGGPDVAPSPDLPGDSGMDGADASPLSPDGAFDSAPNDLADTAATADDPGDFGVDSAPNDLADTAATADDPGDFGVDSAPNDLADTAATADDPGDFGVDSAPNDLADTAATADATADACGASEVRCGGRCVDLQSDGANCGGCGSACSVERHGSARCVGGRCAAASCAAILEADRRAADGRYLLDLDGAGPLEARVFHCDMRGGGWTLVENQVPSAPLPDETGNVNPVNFGRVDASWRLGVPDILAVRPGTAWKLTDDANAVFFRPTCVVDWRVNYTTVMTPTACTTGFTSTAFTEIVNGGWVYCSARGIGINNSGRPCSIRGSEGGPPEQGAGPHGRAYSCAYDSTRERVSLWFR